MYCIHLTVTVHHLILKINNCICFAIFRSINIPRAPFMRPFYVSHLYWILNEIALTKISLANCPPPLLYHVRPNTYLSVHFEQFSSASLSVSNITSIIPSFPPSNGYFQTGVKEKARHSSLFSWEVSCLYVVSCTTTWYHKSPFRTDKIKAQMDEGIILPWNEIVVIGIVGIFLRNVRATKKKNFS